MIKPCPICGTPFSTGRHATTCSKACYVLTRTIEAASGCWLWEGPTNRDGYPTITVAGVNTHAHRVVYEDMVGSIPAGLVLDHTCHNPATCIGGRECVHRLCVNPEHMEPVTEAENALRGGKYLANRSRCRSGRHVLAATGTFVDSGGHSRCIPCRKESKGYPYA